MYSFNHRTSGSPWPSWSGDALHGYEIDHVFGMPYLSSEYTDAERDLSGRIMTFWTNFAKTGFANKIAKGLSRVKIDDMFIRGS